MPSAPHYQALEPQTSDDDEDIENCKVPALVSTPCGGAATPAAMTMPPRWSRPRPVSSVSSRRRCWLPVICVVGFFLVFFYFTLNSENRFTLGLGNANLDDSEDAVYGAHNGLDSTNSHAINESLHICSESHEDRRVYMQDKPRNAYAQLPVIYFVTPTYPRREQIPELTRLAHTLLHVPHIHWLVANDHERCDTFIDILLNRFGIPFTHMASPMPSKFRGSKPAPRGVANRRAVLQWIRQNNLTNGILYFGDDDNTYDLRLFDEIRPTQRVSMFPVGLIADYAVSGPVVRQGKVVAFLDSWIAGRRWPVDMAGFAVNLNYMSQYPNVNMPYKPGYEEDLFLRSINLHIDQIEPRGNNCTEILVWHTQTKNKKAPVVRLEAKYMDGRSNLGALFRALKVMGVASASDNEGPIALISKNGKEKSHSLILS
ncbi:uncharacterized protein Dwil_GK23869 [Drosophila willistoni]|uniref:Galactosylgalactosylxylosylprotein 3-beta-glucuronosyltransferase n=1 Tax=Drosophila willistoni TaxID=7260 RepID=B4MTL9_DROWI|nr:galactosylgalactosylxylosylprotein 3-beta-glucuronosyltransferase S [Drosophila willistoni]EDW75458.1 uncharacterized protein Dwil_GK23869 [Drosophila willistoni]